MSRKPIHVNRLSIQASEVQHRLLEGHLTKVKTLVISSDTDWKPSISLLGDLRVLDLRGCYSLQNDDIKDIGKLFHLKCLIIGGKYITRIPENIGNLLFLETLDLRESGAVELPESIIQIKQLKRLYVNSGTNIPQAIGKLEALQELGDINISNKQDLLKELCKLSKLRVLRISIWSWSNESLKMYEGLLQNLRSLVQASQNIQSLSILTCCPLDFMDSLGAQWAPPSLQNLEIRYGAFDELPRWIGSLNYLSSLSIEVSELSQPMIDLLGKLPALCSLCLTSKHCPQGVFGKDTDGFKNLASLQLVSNVMTKMFDPEAEAMPKLERLTLRFQASLTEAVNHGFNFGVEGLCSLRLVRVEIICFNGSHRMLENAEAAIRRAIARSHNNAPNLEIRRVGEEDIADSEIKVGFHDAEQNQQEEASKETRY